MAKGALNEARNPASTASTIKGYQDRLVIQFPKNQICKIATRPETLALHL
jgi:hypothetical protein